MKKKSNDQGYLILANGEGDTAGLGYTDGACCGDKVGDMVRFLRERRRGNKGK